MLRLNDIGLAEELYLRLKNEEAEISELAYEYSLARKYTKGIVGPMPLSKTNEQVRAISTKENIGKLNKPLVIQKTIVIAVVEHIIEASLTSEMEDKLIEELYNIELQKSSQQNHRIAMKEERDSKANVNESRILKLIEYFQPFKELDKKEKSSYRRTHR